MYFTPVIQPIKTTYRADGHHCGSKRDVSKLQYIILHATGGTDSRAWLSTTSPLSAPVSVHRLITKNGDVYGIVNDDVTAYHAGFAMVGPIGPDRNAQGQQKVNMNTVSLGIELENLNTGKDPYPTAQLQSLVNTLINWWSAYGYLPMLTHKQTDTRKVDPAGFPWTDFYKMLYTTLRTVV